MQIFGVSLSSITDVLNIRGCFFLLRVFLQFFFFWKFKVKFGRHCVRVLCTGMVNTSPQKIQSLDFLGMLKKIIAYDLQCLWSSLFIPYLGCCVLKYQT